MATTSLTDQFSSVDWNFSASASEQDIHPYPCRFIPEIPRAAIEVLDVEGPILDPFCGSGTTLVESLRRGNDAIGIDLNPIACLISRVKTTRVARDVPGVADEHLANLLRGAIRGDRGTLTRMHENVPRLDHWFDPWAQEQLAGAVSYIHSLEAADPWRDIVSLAVSSSIVRISRQDSDTRYAAVDKTLEQSDGLTALEASFRRVDSWLLNRQPALEGLAATVVEGDARELDWIPESSIGGAIFSPPYPNAYEYWLYHKYRMYWLDFDPIAVRADEIGARPHYSKKNGLTADDFGDQMQEFFRSMARALKANAPVVTVVGDAQIRGDRVDVGDLMASTAEAVGYKVLARSTRTLRRSSFNRAHSRARDGEHVLLLAAP